MELTFQEQLRRLDKARAKGDQEAVNAMVALMRKNGNDPSQAQSGSIDMDTGADIGTRLAVNNAPAGDKLGAMRARYPEASPYGKDNFVYYNRETGQPQIYNPEGIDVGDFVGGGRLVANVLGGIGAGVVATPTTPFGQAVALSSGATGAGILYDEAVEGIFGTPDSRGASEQIMDYGFEAVMNMLPFEKALGKAKDVVSPYLRDVMTTANKKVIDVANRYNIRPTAGVIGNKMMQSVDAATQKLMGSVDTWQKSADEMMEGVGRMMDDFFGSMGGKVSPESAGQQIVNQAKKYVDNFKATSTQMYKEVENLIGPDGRVVAPRFNEFLAEYGERFAGDPGFAKLLKSPLLADLAEAQGDDIAYSTLSQVRSMIGNHIDDGTTIGDLAQRDLKRIYAALTEDMFEGAASFGPEALKAATDANDFYKAGASIIDDIIDPNMKIGGQWATGLEAFKAFKRQVADPDKLKRLQQSGVLDESDLQAGGAALLDDLGRATKGQQDAAGTRISPSRIISQTDDRVIPQASQDILFTGSSKDILNDMRVFSEATRGVDSFVNNSNTASSLHVQQVLSGGSLAGAFIDPVVGLTSAVTTVALPYLASKSIQANWLKNWMLNAPREGGERAIAQWVKDGTRIAAAENMTNVFDAVLEMAPDLTRSEVPNKKGALAE